MENSLGRTLSAEVHSEDRLPLNPICSFLPIITHRTPHVVGVELVEVEGVARGAYPKLCVDVRREALNARQFYPPDAVGREPGYLDAAVVVGDGGGEEDVPDGRPLALEPAAGACVYEEVGGIRPGLHLLQREEGGHRGGDL